MTPIQGSEGQDREQPDRGPVKQVASEATSERQKEVPGEAEFPTDAELDQFNPTDLEIYNRIVQEREVAQVRYTRELSHLRKRYRRS